MIERVWSPGHPVDVRTTLAPLRRGAGDPAHHVDAGGTFWWAAATPHGHGTLALRQDAPMQVSAQAWGDGAQWLIDRMPTLLGADDDWSALDVSSLPLLHDIRWHRPGLRLPATGLVMDALVPAVLEQRVTGMQARQSWRDLLRRFGTPAPGQLAWLRVPPIARTLLDIPSWDWHRLGVDGQRQRAIRAAATVAHRLEECTSLDPPAAARRLQSLPGIGPWTVAETVQRALGDPDTVSVGDYHLADVVVHFFTGNARGTDDEMLELLEPWRGQRQRVVRLIELSGVGKPKFGPRYAPLDIRAM